MREGRTLCGSCSAMMNFELAGCTAFAARAGNGPHTALSHSAKPPIGPRADDPSCRSGELVRANLSLNIVLHSSASLTTLLLTPFLHSVLVALDLGLGPYAEESSTNTGCLPSSLWTLRGGEAVRSNSGCRICLFSPNEEPGLEQATKMPFPQLSCSSSVRTTYVTQRRSRGLTRHRSPRASRRANCLDEYTAICVEACVEL